MCKHPYNILIKANNNCWGYLPTEDIGKYQKEALEGAFKMIDAKLTGEIEDVNKFYSKE
jgi:hypothetical protein